MNRLGFFTDTRWLIAGLMLILVCSVSHRAVGQTKLEIVQAGTLAGDRTGGKNWQYLTDNVILKQENTLLYCDSAMLDKTKNDTRMYGNVRIVGDSADLRCDSLYYQGNTKRAMAYSNVVLDNSGLTLRTQRLDWDRNRNLAYYLTEEFIKDGDKDLYSRRGRYDIDRDEFFFRDSVRLEHPSYRMESDTLFYNSATEVAYFSGPTYIYNDESTIYCENGWYDTRQDQAQFQENAVMTNETAELSGDSLFYDRIAGLGRGFCSVQLLDTAEGVRIIGDYGVYYESNKSGKLWELPTAVLDFGGDSMYLHADTLLWSNDTTNASRLSSYPFTRFFQNSMQGQCDSLHYTERDSLIYMYRDPIMWSDRNQITGDSIRVKMRASRLDSMFIDREAFIVAQEDSLKYQQIKGKRMVGLFNEKELYRLNVKGNGQSIYFVLEDGGDFIGINKTKCSDMHIYLRDNDIHSISFINKPSSDLIPPQELEPSSWYLEGFAWKGAWRPVDRYGIYLDPREQLVPPPPMEAVEDGTDESEELGESGEIDLAED